MTSSRVSKSAVSRQIVAPSAVAPSTNTHRTSADVIDRPSTRSTWPAFDPVPIGSETTALTKFPKTVGKSRTAPASPSRVRVVPQMDRRNMMFMAGLGALAAAIPLAPARANPADRVSPPAAPPDAAGGAYLFSDEFDGPNGGAPNPANWTGQNWQDDV